MATSEQKKIREWVKAAERRGWTVTIEGRGSHLKWRDENGALMCVTAGTPGGGNRSIDNMRALLRRVGLREIQ